MANTLTGIEIGNYSVKIAECVDGKVVNFASAEVPDGVVRDGIVVSWQTMADLIVSMIKENKIGCKRAAFVLPDSQVYTRRIVMPVMSEEQLKVNLPYEFHDYIDDDKDNYVYDYSMIRIINNEENNPKEMEFLAVAASKTIIEDYTTLAKKSGLKIVTAMPEMVAINSIIRKIDDKRKADNETDTPKDYAVLDLGDESVRIDIYTGGHYDATRNIETGCGSITSAIADVRGIDRHIAEVYKHSNKDDVLNDEACAGIYSQIAIEVMRVINFYTFNNRNNTLDALYYFGGGSYIESLLAEIATTIELPMIKLGDVLYEEDENGSASVTKGAAAVGITLG